MCFVLLLQEHLWEHLLYMLIQESALTRHTMRIIECVQYEFLVARTATIKFTKRTFQTLAIRTIVCFTAYTAVRHLLYCNFAIILYGLSIFFQLRARHWLE
jgi:riboflavin transporter FmnP